VVNPDALLSAAVVKLRERILATEHTLALLKVAGIRARRLERDLATWRRTYALMCDVQAEWDVPPISHCRRKESQP
jgi:hypothetical protein